jgi:Zn-dependent metalloprotease
LGTALVDDDEIEKEPGIRVAYHPETGRLTFLGSRPDQPIIVRSATAKGMLSEDRAVSLMNNFGQLFGIYDVGAELRTVASSTDIKSITLTEFQQVYQGIPIIGGEIHVNLRESGELLSINGEVSPSLDLITIPQIRGEAARQTAIAAVSKWVNTADTNLIATDPELWIYDPRLISQDTFPPVLVWRIEVVGIDRLDVDYLVLVNAISGGIRLAFNQTDTALDRMTYDAGNGTSLPGSLVCNEGNPSCSGGDAHEVAAHVYAGDTYNFYWTYHGRDSIDDAGMTLISTVHYGSGYQNAFWSGSQMVYGDGAGFPLADDVVAHELTHGVTQYESGLFYYYESGAINESLSDIWGEFVDQVNGAGDDSSGVKWLLGEDIAGWGAIRDMEHPPAFGDPDKMTSGNYAKPVGNLGDIGFDNGGVHTNSGVNNKAAFLMTDGGSFNGYVVDPLGITKVAAIYYEVQTKYLTSGSGYADLYNFLYQGCLNLIGGAEGITDDDCGEVLDAINAVEMNIEPQPGYNPEAVSCPGGDFPAILFIDNLEAGAGNWVFGSLVGPNSWQWDTGYSSSGDYMLYGSDGPSVELDSYAELNVDVHVPAGYQAYLHFNHAFGFEDPQWDGGLIDYSINGGTNWTDASSLFDGGLDYTGTISTFWGNPNGGSDAFIGDSHGYVSSRYDLTPLAGEDVRFRWRVSSDGFISDLGWVIDDVRIYLCGEGVLVPMVVD